MEHLPVEIIGNILSLLKSAQDVVVASATCKKWREACRTHLHSLNFNSDDWPVSRNLSARTLEVIITQMVIQTTGLQNLSILMDDVEAFSASSVIAWLMHTRYTIFRLRYSVNTVPSINIIDKCGRQKLETLALANNPISRVEPAYHKFPCLNSLSLCCVTISVPDLNLLISACPRLEKLAVIDPKFTATGGPTAMELRSSSLKDIFVEDLSIGKFTLEADTLETLHLKGCDPQMFKLIGKGTLRVLKLDEFMSLQLGIGDNTENLEIVDLSNFTIVWRRLYPLISKASMLKRLRLWDVTLYDSDEEVVDLGSISTTFPKLTHLSISWDLRRGAFHHNLQKSFQMENVTILELGWRDTNDFFSEWAAKFVETCPKLKKLTICGVVSGADTDEECHTLSCFATSFVELMRNHLHIEVVFVFE